MLTKLLIFGFVLRLSSGKFEQRIVGGVEVNIESASYQVAVLLGKFLCGGTLVTENAVITAAHCTDKSLKDRANAKVRAGSTSYFEGGELVPVAKIYDYPDYDPNYNDFDISILKLTYNLKLSSSIRIVGIASYERKTGIIAAVSGWGRTNPNDDSSVSRALQILKVPFINSDICKKQSLYGDRISDNMVCAGYINDSGFDSCQGDSGGPLVHEYELIGIVSWGDGCASAGYPGVYTNVYYFRNWILSVLNEVSPNFSY